MRSEPNATGRADDTTIRIAGLKQPLTLVQVTDSHLTEVDARDPDALERGLQLRADFLARDPDGIGTREQFRRALATSSALDADMVVLTGDIIHFPSQANLEAIRDELAAFALPYLYTPGNHDWHFPHLEWSDATRARFYPRFNDLTAGNPAFQARDLGGVRLIAIDNSNYQISPAQLAFLEAQLSSGLPCLLFVHIPFFLQSLAPDVVAAWGAPIMMAASGWTEATQAAWRVRDADASTRQCYDLLMGAAGDNVAGIFCGHVHFPHVDAFRPERQQYVTRPGFAGGLRVIRLSPEP